MQHFSARLTIALSLLAPVNAASAETVDIYPDTWVAIDDLEREMPTYETEPLKTDKTVLFQYSTSPGIMTTILTKNVPAT